MPYPLKRMRHSAPALLVEDLAEPHQTVAESRCPAHEDSLIGMCAALALKTPLALLLLEDPDSRVRLRTLDGLCQLGDPDLLASYAGAVVQLAQDSQWEVRKRALEVLQNVPAARLCKHACNVAACIFDAQWPVRRAAVSLLSRLPASTLVMYAHPVAQLLEDPAWSVRWHAVQALSVIDEAATREQSNAPDGASGHAKFSQLVRSARAKLCADLEKRHAAQAAADTAPGDADMADGAAAAAAASPPLYRSLPKGAAEPLEVKADMVRVDMTREPSADSVIPKLRVAVA